MGQRNKTVNACIGTVGFLLLVCGVLLNIQTSNVKRQLHGRLKRSALLQSSDDEAFNQTNSTGIVSSGDQYTDTLVLTNQNATEATSEPRSTEIIFMPLSDLKITTEPTSEPHAVSETSLENNTMASEPEAISNALSESNNISEITSEPISEPETSTTPISEPETTSEPMSEPETTSEPRSEPETTSEPVSEPETTSEPRSEPETTSEPRSEPETTSEPKSEPETTSEPRSEPETTSEPRSEPETTSEPVSEPETTSEPRSEPETTSEPRSEPETTSEPRSEPETSSEPRSEPETTSEPRSEPETTSEPRSEPETTSEPESEPESTSEPRSEPESTSEPESEPESTSEPESEPESTSEPESEPESTSEPETEPEVTSEPRSEPEFEPSFPEPVPNWAMAMEEYKWGWDLLVYIFGIMFLLLGLYSIFNIYRLWRIEHLISRNYFVTLTVLIVIMCFMRGLYLVIDAHNRNGTFPIILNYFLYSTALPCLTSAFSILFYALLLATRVKVLSTRIQKLSLLIGIISFHFALSIITDIVVGIFFDARILMIVCQFFYVVWGTVLFVGYFYIFNKLRTAALTRSKNYSFTSASTLKDSRRSGKKSRNQYTLSTSVKITFAAAIFGLLCVMLEIYGIFGVYRLYLVGHIPQPWPYFTYHFMLRLVEFCMCSLMVYVSSQPIMIRRNKSDGIFSKIYRTFTRMCCVPQDESNYDSEPSSSVANSNALVLINASDDFDKKVTIVNFDIQDNNGKHEKNMKEQSHLVIKDGLVRFKAEEDSVTGSETGVGTSLPDLVHGAVQYGTNVDSTSISSDTGVYNHGYKENELNQIRKLRRSDTEPSNDLKRSIDFEKMSIGTFGTDITRPLSSINLTNSLEWEFEQAYERSFTHNHGSTKSLPSDLSACSAGNCSTQLLNEESPNQQRNGSSVLSDDSDMGVYSEAPALKPLIKKANDVKNVTGDSITKL